MAKLVTLEEDGDLGPAGTQVWVNDEDVAPPVHKVLHKAAPRPHKAAPKPRA